MKKSIAALIIAAAMIITPGISNAYTFYALTQHLFVNSNGTSNFIAYRYNNGSFQYSAVHTSNWLFAFNAYNNTTMVAYLYNYDAHRYTNFIRVYKQAL